MAKKVVTFGEIMLRLAQHTAEERLTLQFP